MLLLPPTLFYSSTSPCTNISLSRSRSLLLLSPPKSQLNSLGFIIFSWCWHLIRSLCDISSTAYPSTPANYVLTVYVCSKAVRILIWTALQWVCHYWLTWSSRPDKVKWGKMKMSEKMDERKNAKLNKKRERNNFWVLLRSAVNLLNDDEVKLKGMRSMKKEEAKGGWGVEEFDSNAIPTIILPQWSVRESSKLSSSFVLHKNVTEHGRKHIKKEATKRLNFPSHTKTFPFWINLEKVLLVCGWHNDDDDIIWEITNKYAPHSLSFTALSCLTWWL